jgi:hypothetical protein
LEFNWGSGKSTDGVMLLTLRVPHLQLSGRNYTKSKDKFLYKKKQLQGIDKSLARPGRKQATATEDFDLHISYL